MAEVKMPEDLHEMFPGNSNKDKEKRRREAIDISLEPVAAKGVAKQVEPSAGRRVRDTFINEDTKSIFSYIMNDVLIPAAKDMIFEAITGGLSMRLFGDSRGYTRPAKTGHTNYNKISSHRSTSYIQPRTPKETRQMAPRNRGYNIKVPTKGEAYEILDRLCTYIERCGYATVNDLCKELDWETEYTYNSYGWVDLDDVRIRPRGNEWVLEIPPAIWIDEMPF